MSTACPEIIVINGTPVDVTAVPIHTSILDFLRSTGRTGSKIGCNEGDCGACTLLLLENDGSTRAINGCLALVPSLVGREIITAEGLAKNGELHPVQKAMVECNGSQCGYCTPGFICSMAEAPPAPDSPIPPPSPTNSAATSAAAPATAPSAMP